MTISKKFLLAGMLVLGLRGFSHAITTNPKTSFLAYTAGPNNTTVIYNLDTSGNLVILGTMTAQGYNAAGLATNQCLQTDGVGNLKTTGGACGSSPVSTASFPFGLTASTITVSTVTVTGQIILKDGTTLSSTSTFAPASGSGNYIQNSATLQSGAVLNVSSGTLLTLNNQNINGTFIGLGRNRVLNGDMEFDQNNESTDNNQSVYTSTNAAHYTLDEWRIEDTNPTSHFTVLRTTTNVPNNFFQTAMQIAVSTPAAVGASDGVNLENPIETWYVRDFAWGSSSAQPVTLQFWVMSSSAGVYSVTFIQNNASARSYVVPYTLTANTWTHEVITIPGDVTPPLTNWPTTGNAQFGLKLVWDLGSGSNVTTSSTNQWINASVWRAAGSNSFISAPSGTKWYLTGVQLEIGTQATGFEYISPDIQLGRLERYFWKTLLQGTPCLSGQGMQGALIYKSALPGTTSGGGVYVTFPTTMSGENDLTNLGGLRTFSAIVGGGNTSWWNNTQSAVSGVPDVTTVGATTAGLFIGNPQVNTDNSGDVMGLHICVSEQLGGP